jgi:2-keto-3-deoxy-L-rhamnonate aldolase RhmA
MTSAIRLAEPTPVARVRHVHTADIGRALDLGCEGVIVPNVDSSAQARQTRRGARHRRGRRRRYREAGCTLITTSADAGAITRDTAAQFSAARA